MNKKERIDEIKGMFMYLSHGDEIWVEIVPDLAKVKLLDDRVIHCTGGRGECPLHWELIRVNKFGDHKTIAKWNRIDSHGKQYNRWKDNIYYPGLTVHDHYNVTESGEIYGRLPNSDLDSYCSKSLNLQNNYYLYVVTDEYNNDGFNSEVRTIYALM